jgi:hypothetical protein
MQILPAAERQRDFPVDEPGLFNRELRFGISLTVTQIRNPAETSQIAADHSAINAKIARLSRSAPSLGEPTRATLQLENLAIP